MSRNRHSNAAQSLISCIRLRLRIALLVAAVATGTALTRVPAAYAVCCVCDCDCTPCGNCSITGCCGSGAVADLAACTNVCATTCSGSVARFSADADCSGGIADSCTSGQNICIERPGTGFCAAGPTATPTSTPTPSVTPTSTPSATPTPTAFMSESQGGAAACSDTVDNDNDMLIDCADPDCFQIGSCRAPAPTMSARLTVLLIGMLTLAGIYQARRRRAH